MATNIASTESMSMSKRALLRLVGISTAVMLVSGLVGFGGAAAWDHLGSNGSDTTQSDSGGSLSSALTGGFGG